jgi:hypothetical protein
VNNEAPQIRHGAEQVGLTGSIGPKQTSHRKDGDRLAIATPWNFPSYVLLREPRRNQRKLNGITEGTSILGPERKKH